ncbi:MAG: hypothetical protein M3460_17795 [Actinomycetota bacterium]|nr:hypothetical protein [Actinomycetota bacterium]
MDGRAAGEVSIQGRPALLLNASPRLWRNSPQRGCCGAVMSLADESPGLNAEQLRTRLTALANRHAQT